MHHTDTAGFVSHRLLLPGSLLLRNPTGRIQALRHLWQGYQWMIWQAHQGPGLTFPIRRPKSHGQWEAELETSPGFLHQPCPHSTCHARLEACRAACLGQQGLSKPQTSVRSDGVLAGITATEMKEEHPRPRNVAGAGTCPVSPTASKTPDWERDLGRVLLWFLEQWLSIRGHSANQGTLENAWTHFLFS